MVGMDEELDFTFMYIEFQLNRVVAAPAFLFSSRCFLSGSFDNAYSSSRFSRFGAAARICRRRPWKILRSKCL